MQYSNYKRTARIGWVGRLVAEDHLQLSITVTDERNVRQIPLAEVFILLFFICVRYTCKIKSAFILSSGDRRCKGVRLFPNCLQKPRKCAFFLGNMRKKFALLIFCTQSVWGSAAILKLSPGAKICAILFCKDPFSLISINFSF